MNSVLTLLASQDLLLGCAALFAGMVDAVVGGGGLITIPVLLGLFPQTAIPTLFGTNKVSAVAGTSSAMWRFGRTVTIPWGVVLPAAIAALVGAWMGAAMVASLPRDWMRPLILVLMVASAAYTFHNKDFGQAAKHRPAPADRWSGGALGLGLGLYDGFFGPGTGSLLIFAFIRLFGMDFLRATASAKVVNCATNIAAIAFFAVDAPLMWRTGILMAACNLIGAQVGTALALRHGSGFIRKVFLLVVVVLIGKLAFDTVRAWFPALL